MSAGDYDTRFSLPENLAKFLKELRGSMTNGEPTSFTVAGTRYDVYSQSQVADLTRRLNDLGWSLRALANAYGISHRTVAKDVEFSRTHLLKDLKQSEIVWSAGELPKAPSLQDEEWRKQVYYQIPDSVADEMRQLQPIAARRRGGVPDNSPITIAARRLTQLMAEEREKGAQIRQIAEILGISMSAVSLRLGRYQFEDLPPSHVNNVTEDLTNTVDIQGLRTEREAREEEVRRRNKKANGS